MDDAPRVPWACFLAASCRMKAGSLALAKSSVVASKAHVVGAVFCWVADCELVCLGVFVAKPSSRTMGCDCRVAQTVYEVSLGRRLSCLLWTAAGLVHRLDCVAACLLAVPVLRLVFLKRRSRVVADTLMSPRLEWGTETHGQPKAQKWQCSEGQGHWGAGETWSWRAAVVLSRRSGAVAKVSVVSYSGSVG